MKIFIFEGIATSGKSTVISELVKVLPNYLKMRVYTEEFTHKPIIDKTNELCNEFFAALIEEAMSKDYDVVLFDRLYLTQAYRAKATLDRYADIEMMLYVNQVKTILLELKEDQVADRIANALHHRDPDWGKYVGTKGQTLEEQAEYYIKQQRGLGSLLGFSKLPHETYEVIDQDYEWIVNELKEKILNL
jgi:thymidylate kinase